MKMLSTQLPDYHIYTTAQRASIEAPSTPSIFYRGSLKDLSRPSTVHRGSHGGWRKTNACQTPFYRGSLEAIEAHIDAPIEGIKGKQKKVSQAQPLRLNKLDKVVNLAERDCIFADVEGAGRGLREPFVHTSRIRNRMMYC
jgi:hypothetical protein